MNSANGVMSYIMGPGLIPQLLLTMVIILALYAVISMIETVVDAFKKLSNQSVVLFTDTTSTKQVIPQGGDNAEVYPQVYNSENEINGMEFSYASWIFINPDTFSASVQQSCGGETTADPNLLKHIFHKGAKDGFPVMAPGVFVHGDKNTLRIYMNSVLNWDNYVEVPNVPIGKWFHLVLTQKGKFFDVYVNGNISVRKQFDAVPRLNFGNVYMLSPIQFPAAGRVADRKIITTFKVDSSAKGMISRLKYFSYALNYAQIDQLYREGPSKKIVSSSFNQQPPYFYDNWWVTKY
ncbi:MAG: hypothetical protein WCJ96_11630 [Verrucomicrobiota bacterium]